MYALGSSFLSVFFTDTPCTPWASRFILQRVKKVVCAANVQIAVATSEVTAAMSLTVLHVPSPRVPSVSSQCPRPFPSAPLPHALPTHASFFLFTASPFRAPPRSTLRHQASPSMCACLRHLAIRAKRLRVHL